MNDYVIINGVNSNTISGLKISKLPPITKPQMRTLIETIDGRDGDLITELGYSAYDKQLEIGLWGTYDINTIISFFNQEGTITFSNEADKFYNFKIINQIDYQKLLKFKTAVVVMHCQPFKYPTNETPIEGTPTTITGEGESLTLNNTFEAPLEIDLKGNTYQNGEPTPDTPIPINVVSGDNEIVVTGKNIANWIQGNVNAQGQFVSSTTSVCTDFIKVNYNDIFTASKNTLFDSSTNDNMMCRMFDKDKNILGSIQALGRIQYSNSFTINNANCEYIRLAQFKSDGISVDNNYELMIENGSIATEYEEYKGASYPVNLGSMELCKIGDYQDRIYKDNGSWYLHKEIGKSVLNGTENYGINTRIGYNYYLFKTNASIKFPNYARISGNTIICNIFNGVNNSAGTANVFSQGNNVCCFRNNTGESQNIFYITSSIDNVDDFKASLVSKNAIVYYVLATPTYTEITDSTLLSQLNALEGANSYDNQTNVSQVNNDYPFWLSASTTFNAPITINNIGNIYAKPILELEGSGNITINLNSQDILAISLGETTTKIVIDIPNLEAYNPTDSTLMNRLVVGDYMKFLINSGNNTLKIDGTITSYRLTSYTRWL